MLDLPSSRADRVDRHLQGKLRLGSRIVLIEREVVFVSMEKLAVRLAVELDCTTASVSTQLAPCDVAYESDRIRRRRGDWMTRPRGKVRSLSGVMTMSACLLVAEPRAGRVRPTVATSNRSEKI